MRNNIFTILVMTCALSSSGATTSSAGQAARPVFAHQSFILHTTGHIVVPVIVNGTTTNMVVDTGAGVTVVDDSSVATLGLQLENREQSPDRSEATGAGGANLPTKNSAGNTISFGGFTEQNVTIMTMDLSHVVVALSETGIDVSGVIGADFLSRHKAVIDYSKRQITLEL